MLPSRNRPSLRDYTSTRCGVEATETANRRRFRAFFTLRRPSSGNASHASPAALGDHGVDRFGCSSMGPSESERATTRERETEATHSDDSGERTARRDAASSSRFHLRPCGRDHTALRQPRGGGGAAETSRTRKGRIVRIKGEASERSVARTVAPCAHQHTHTATLSHRAPIWRKIRGHTDTLRFSVEPYSIGASLLERQTESPFTHSAFFAFW